MTNVANQTSITSAKKIVVVGAGGNIGSHLVPHLARMSNVSRVTLIDRDVYEAKNLWSQDISPGDVGKRKVGIQARRLRRINHELKVETIFDAVERVPLGKIFADVILACLDSRIARQHVSQFAWRLGVPLIDAGVEPTSLLARINVYVPGADRPCLECAWDDRDYDALEHTYPCARGASKVAATNAPSSLGALAASLQAIECEKLLRGEFENVAVSKQVLIDAANHKHYVTAFRRNPNCRFAAHRIWNITKLHGSASRISVAEVLALVPAGAGNNGSLALRIEGKPFVKRLTCSACGDTRSLLRLECSLAESDRLCTRCGAPALAAGFDLVEELSARTLEDERLLNRSLRRLGFRNGEVFSIVESDGELHYQLEND
ncbi:MAG TPA: ThiF family adenylyltransferase [Blastocatellia bacterium]|nr:ThiF family adenylyltransferase [Blastocatellia bacterium]